MITPRLLRRALFRGLQPRLLFLWWASLALPGAIAALPAFHFLRRELDRSTRAQKVVAWLDGSTALELLRQLSENGAGTALAGGAVAAALALFFLSPFTAGAMVAAARSDEALPVQRLLAGAGELYGRMLRTLACGLLPLGAGAALAAAVMKLASRAAERDLTETAAALHLRLGLAVCALILFLCHLLLDAARAQFAAERWRRSAFAALFGGLKLIVRRPLRALAAGALGTVSGLGAASLLMLLRLRLEQGTLARIALAWLLAQAAQVAVGWGRATRIFALTELTRADAADRARPFQLAPPSASEAALLEPAAPLSPKDASGT